VDDGAVEEEAETPEVGDETGETDTGHAGPNSLGENEDLPPYVSIKDTSPESSAALYDDPSDDDDGEGEWITPSNVALHKSRALHLLPHANGKSKRTPKVASVGCMTADFAMQNLLLHMGLDLIGVEGERIEEVKTWVLRCHACFKYV
jgi:RNA-binding protein NOB1